MKIDENKTSVSDSESGGDRQNRREFFNGLGKWSMVVVAAVSLLRGSLTTARADREGTVRPEWESPETDFPRLAAKWRQYVKRAPGHDDIEHGDLGHVDRVIHDDHKIMQ